MYGKCWSQGKQNCPQPFLKEFLRKLFKIKCKAFLKSLEILEEEKPAKSLQSETMLRAKLKVYGLDKN